MPRRPAIIRPTRLALMLPEDVRARIDLALYSEVEGKVPFGAYQEFFLARIHEHFEEERLDLAPYAQARHYVTLMPGEAIVRASPATITTLKRMLES